METFQFPFHEELFQRIQTKTDLKLHLKRELEHLKVKKQYFKLYLRSDKYMYAKCCICAAHLKYKKEQTHYILTSFNFQHHHESENSSNEIQKFIENLPLTMSTQSQMQMATNALGISKNKFYYHNRKIWFEKRSFKEVVQQLDLKNNETRMLPFPLQENQLPDIFLTANKSMINNFQRFGKNQFVTFDITYNIVREVKVKMQNNELKEKKWGLGLFLGKNNHNKALCFCICLINTETKDSLRGVFKSFFEMMNGEPDAIITDEQSSIEAAINDLRQNGDYFGGHFLDSFHVLRNITKKTRNEGLVRSLKEAMFAKTDNQYKKQLRNARQYCNSTEQLSIYERFSDRSHKYCLSQTKPHFHGISISTSFGQKVNDVVKNFIPREFPFNLVLKKVMHAVQFLEQKSQEYKQCTISYEDIFHWKQIKVLKKILCQPIFLAFLKNYVDSLPMMINQERNFWIVDEHKVQIIGKMLRCQCGYLQKSGLPCSHLIKTIIEIHEDIFLYINDRWKIQRKVGEKSFKIKKGRPRISRRR